MRTPEFVIENYIAPTPFIRKKGYDFRPAIRRGSVREFFGSDPNLKGCWSLDGHARDESGNGNHGTLEGSIVPSDGRFRRGYYFDAVNDDIKITHNASINVGAAGSSYSICVWAACYGNVGAFGDFLVGKALTIANIPNPVSLILTITNNVNFHMYDASSNGYFVGSKNVSDRLFHNIWGVRNNNTLYLLFDGKLVGISTYASIPDCSNTANMYFGNYTATPSTERFWGKMCECALFKRYVSPAEIAQYYQWAISEPRKYWFYSPVLITGYPQSRGYIIG